MGAGGDIIPWLTHELMLFAAVGIFVIALEDLFADALWLGWRATTRLQQPAEQGSHRASVAGTLAVFVPAWDESAVIGATLRRMLSVWQDADVRLYVAVYPNDPATAGVVDAVDDGDRIVRVTMPHAGPTTKGDALITLWRALAADAAAGRITPAAVVLHDAEDVVHPDEPRVFRSELARAAMVQLPVRPALPAQSLFVGGHYADEFAEAHGKELPLRAALGLAFPLAGVGCAIRWDAICALAARRGGAPFAADTLTEDYEMGLALGAFAGPGVLADAMGSDGSRVVSRGAFPITLSDAARQKGRWIAGIALAGWDRVGWHGRGAERRGGAGDRVARKALHRWMLWRDRRAPLAALIVLAAYIATILYGVSTLGVIQGWWAPRPLSPALTALLTLNTALLIWRLGWRSLFTARSYGWRQGMLSIPRAVVANLVAMLASWRALILFLQGNRGRAMRWDKTRHVAWDPAE